MTRGEPREAAAATETKHKRRSFELGEKKAAEPFLSGAPVQFERMFSLGETMEFLLGNPFSTPVGQRIGKAQLLLKLSGCTRSYSSLVSILYPIHLRFMAVNNI